MRLTKTRIASLAVAALAACFAVVEIAAAGTVIEGIPKGPGAKTATVVGKAMALPPLKGPKKTVAVNKFENKSGWVGEWNLSEGFTEMLNNALIDSGRFNVYERTEIEDVLTEQDFAASDRATTAGRAALTGKMIPVQFLISGAVTEFSHVVQDTGGGIVIKDVALGGKVQKGQIAVVVRIIDTTTGQIITSKRVEGKAERFGVNFDITKSDYAIGGEHFQQTPMGEAVQKALNQAVLLIAQELDKQAWRGRVAKVDEGKVYINAGKNCNIQPGDSFAVYTESEPITDPDTGEVLGTEETKLGRLSVARVLDKLSICTVEEGEEPERGDLVKYEP